MTYDVVSVDFHGTVHDVIEKIAEDPSRWFPGSRREYRYRLHLSADLLFVQPSTPVGKVMSDNLIVADPEMDINDAARVIFRSGIQKLPVVDEKNHLLGIISNSDVIRSQIEHVSPEKVFNFMTTLKKLYNVDPTLDRGHRTGQGNSSRPSRRSTRMNWKEGSTRSRKDLPSRSLS